MPPESLPLAHLKLLALALDDKQIPFAHPDQSANPFGFHISGNAEYFLLLLFGFVQEIEFQLSNREQLEKCWRLLHSHHAEFAPSEKQQHREL